MQPNLPSGRLNEQQLDMIRLFEKPMPEEDYLQIRRLAVQLLAKQLDKLVEEWEEKNGITEEYYEKLSKEHLRSSTNISSNESRS